MQTMSASLDLYILPVVRQNGVDHSDLPGVFPALPPRRTARGRETDRIVLYLTLTGVAANAGPYQAILEGLADTYFKTAGTATAAMRTVAESLNETLLERNLRNAQAGQQSIGLLTQIVLRSDMVYLAHSGPVHTFLLSGNAPGTGPQHLFDSASSGRGLGIGRQVAIRYFHCTLQGGQYMLPAHQASPSWELESMVAAPNQDFENLRRKLVAIPDQELNALLIQAQPGTGKLNLMRLKTPAVDMARPAQVVAPAPAAGRETPKQPIAPPVETAEKTAAPSPLPVSPPAPRPEIPAERAAQETKPQVVPLQANPVQQMPKPESAGVTMQSQSAQKPTAPPPSSNPPSSARQPASSVSQPAAQPPHPKPASASTPNPVQKAGAAFYLALRTFGQAVRLTFKKIGQGLFELLRRILPDETMLDFSPSTLLFLAIVIPLLISVAGAMMYVERGQRTQFEALYQQAAQEAQTAQAETDPAKQRSAWNQALTTLDQAERYMKTADSQNLRLQAGSILDQLDGVTRLDFRPAIIGGLDKKVIISRLASFENDLYILDSARGRVLRAIFTGGGYELDPSFDCGPSAGAIFVDAIVDIAAFPRFSDQNSTLLAMDRNGVVLQCIPGDSPLIQQLTPGNTNFGTPRAFDLDNNNVYVLDPSSNAVWIYPDLKFGAPPHFYFGDQIPPMQNVVDLTVDGDHLYLLHSDGHQTRCTYSEIAGIPTRCEDPYAYTDRRPGRQNGAVFTDALFDQIFLAPPPEPSLYLLDPEGRSIYRFGLQLSFNTQYRSSQPLPEGSASAFTISKSRLVFMAVGNEVLYAPLP